MLFFVFFSYFLDIYFCISHRKWLTDIQTKIHHSLDSVFPINSNVVLLDVPNHLNLGDSFIWFGTRIYFEKRNISIVAERFQNWNKNEIQNIMRKHGNSILALQGGGNYGDLYPLHQKTRFKAFNDFPNVKKVILPQSVHYMNSSKIIEDSPILGSFSNITFFCRCHESLKLMEQQHSCKDIVNFSLSPDMAFMIGDVESVEVPSYDVIFISRKGEKRTEYKDTKILEKSLKLKNISMLVTDWADWSRHITDTSKFSKNHISEFKLQIARALLSKGKIVLSDRMHAIILGLLMEKPVVALDNFYDKFGRLYNTFLSEYSDDELNLKRVNTYEKAYDAIETLLQTKKS